jgi:hypothetical protein
LLLIGYGLEVVVIGRYSTSMNGVVAKDAARGEDFDV